MSELRTKPVGKPRHGGKLKVKTTISIDESLKRKAIKRDGKLSIAVEKALIKYLGE